MKSILQLVFLALFSLQVGAQNLSGSEEERASLKKETLAIRDAFAKGDAALAASLHHPDIVKYFGGTNVISGRTALEKGLTEWFRNSTIEFVENTIESTVFSGNIAIETSIFSIRATPKTGGSPVINRGRAMVVYIKDKTSPTGWFSLREMAQAAPERK